MCSRYEIEGGTAPDGGEMGCFRPVRRVKGGVGGGIRARRRPDDQKLRPIPEIRGFSCPKLTASMLQSPAVVKATALIRLAAKCIQVLESSV